MHDNDTESRPVEALRVWISTQSDTTVVTVVGEVDYLTAPRLAHALDTALLLGARRLRVDFGGVSFCDCCGLNVLLEMRGRCLDAGVGFWLSTPLASEVERLLDLTETGPVLLSEPATTQGPRV
ncbi:STAS domain-containing protein [Streptomyces sp. NPDC101209]|uniref:STAS domain-containing protein n=1 Tax=Streptomyces sp. NPDC101209 TaxID=3366129 RepID=UPI0038025EEB